MKKDIVILVFKLLGTGFITLGSLFGYVDGEKKVYEKPIFLEKQKIAEVTTSDNNIETVPLEEEKQDEVEEEVIFNIPETITPTITEPVYEIPKMNGNTIEIPNVYQNTLLRDSGNHFYLNHNINGDYDGIGVPYIDFRNDFTGRKTILYGHSSTLGNGPFQVFQNYHNNPGFYQQNPYINIYYGGLHYTYHIFSVYVSLADSEQSEGLEFYRVMDYSDEEWERTILKYKNNSEYDTGVSVNNNDKILIIQTCSMDPNYYAKYYRYNLLVMGKLISIQ